MERLILARHGESEFSARAAVNGDATVACPLTDEGRAQSRRLAELLADDELDLCVTTEFGRTQETAALALAGRAVPVLVLPELNDPRAGEFEGRPVGDYQGWAWAAPAAADAPGGGESRAGLARRYAAALRLLLGRPERTILVVGHALPIAYVLRAVEGLDPEPRVDRSIGYAEPHRLDAETVRAAADRLARWAEAPTW